MIYFYTISYIVDLIQVWGVFNKYSPNSEWINWCQEASIILFLMLEAKCPDASKQNLNNEISI